MQAIVVAVCLNSTKGEKKYPVESVALRENHGVVGDGHAGEWHRQLSLLSQESVETMRARGADVSFGDFGENICTRGIDLVSLPVGSRLALGDAVIEITQIGKPCVAPCAIFYQAGDCVMPREGVFARVITGGEIAAGTPIFRL